MPDQTREYHAARHGVALFDRSSLGKVSVTGRDRLAFLQGMLTNDVKALTPGQGARALLEGLAGATLDLAPYAHAEVTVGGAPVRVINRAEGPAPGFHCWTEAASAESLRSAALAAGAVVAGPATLEILRIEAGQPWYPQDVDQSVILPETRLEALVSYTKGCYIGQETVARVKYRGHVNRALSGLVVEGDRVPEVGARVVVAGAEVGKVTSAARRTRSPRAADRAASCPPGTLAGGAWVPGEPYMIV